MAEPWGGVQCGLFWASEGRAALLSQSGLPPAWVGKLLLPDLDHHDLWQLMGWKSCCHGISFPPAFRAGED